MTHRPAVSRREFLRLLIACGFSASAAGALLSLSSCDADESSELPAPPPAATQAPPEAMPTGEAPAGADSGLVIARGPSPTALAGAAIAALGGIEAFVKPGDNVIIKPNMVAADYSFEYAAYTNPELVGAVTALCVGAGAGRVRVMDRPASGTCERVYARSGIGDAVAAAGGEMEVMSDIKYRKADIQQGRDITRWPVYGDVLDADVLINMPIAKHHNLAKLTLSLKNLMGVIMDRSQFHRNLGQRLADLASLVRPTLTIMDAVHVLMANGPRGGNLSDVKQMDTVVAGRDFVAVGSYTTTFFGKQGADIDALRCASEMGLGTLDYEGLRIEEVAV